VRARLPVIFSKGAVTAVFAAQRCLGDKNFFRETYGCPFSLFAYLAGRFQQNSERGLLPECQSVAPRNPAPAAGAIEQFINSSERSSLVHAMLFTFSFLRASNERRLLES
jgi:hypothetical protein